MKRTFLTLSVCCCIFHGYAQNKDLFSQMSQQPVRSPNAAALAKYIEYPVSYYNGQPNITLPVYRVKTGDIDLPITLTYQSGGVKVAEESSWVGLSWSLQGGGMITHVIKSADDNCSSANTSYNKIFPVDSANRYDAGFAPRTVGPQGTVYKSSGVKYQPLLDNNPELYNAVNASLSCDGEPDVYLYHFGNYSGKFFWVNGAGSSIEDLTRNNIRFTTDGNSITAVTPDGYTYFFGQTEKSFNGTCPTIQAYYLTKITSPLKKSVTFEYQSFYALYNSNGWSSQFETFPQGSPNQLFTNGDYVAQLPTLTEWYMQCKNLGPRTDSRAAGEAERGLHRIFNYTATQEYFLSKINFDNGYITFSSSPRNDAYGVKLDAVSVYRTDSTLANRVSFSYGYFNSVYVGGDFYDNNITSDNARPYYPASYRNKRLKLLSMTATDGGLYSFDYYEGNGGTLPSKTSFSQDYWGYFNSAGNSTLVPDLRRYLGNASIPDILNSWTGANRNEDAASNIQGTLKKIYYPTGGNTEFTFEQHHYSNITNERTSSIIPVVIPVMDISTGVQEKLVHFDIDTRVNINVSLFCNNGPDLGTTTDCACFYSTGCYSADNLRNGLYASVVQVDPITLNPINGGMLLQWDKFSPAVQSSGGNFTLANQNFPAGTYKITVNYPDNKAPGSAGQRMANVTLTYDSTASTATAYRTAGGLRIAKIKSYDPLAAQTIERNFTYSNGTMMYFPEFFYQSLDDAYVPDGRTGNIIVGATWESDYLYSNPVVPFSYSANGSTVGYATVTETLSGGQNGKVVYDYHCVPDKYYNTDYQKAFPGISSVAYLDDGFLEKTAFYDSASHLVKDAVNTQTVLLTKTYWPFKYKVHGFENATGTTVNSNLYFKSGAYFYFTPLQIGKLLNATTVETDYQAAAAFVTTQKFTYNGQGNIKTSALNTSNGTQVQTSYAYAPDYTNVSTGFILEMRNRNMISVPVETLTRRNGNVIEGNYVIYRLHDSLLTPYQFYRPELIPPANIASTAPSGSLPPQFVLKGMMDYDSLGNQLYTRLKNNVYQSTLWDYRNALPVAQVENASPAAIAYTSFEADGKGNWNIPAGGRIAGGITGGRAYILSNGTITSRTLETSKNYMVSYWSASGPALVNGVTATALATKKGYSYYEHKLPAGTTAVTVSGTATIDELRLFPADARMTTYTYDPLYGLTSMCGPDNHISYYRYDDQGRLTMVLDQDGNILRTVNYHYIN